MSSNAMVEVIERIARVVLIVSNIAIYACQMNIELVYLHFITLS